MLGRWKDRGLKYISCIVVFLIVDLLFIWSFVTSKQTSLLNEYFSQSQNQTVQNVMLPPVKTVVVETSTVPVLLGTRSVSEGGGLGPNATKRFVNWQNLKAPYLNLEFKAWLNRGTWKKDDPELVESVREVFLIPPSTEPYKPRLLNAIYKKNPSDGQVQALRKVLKKLTPGFFIESGANDGLQHSNTMWLEKELGWNGLLVEADPYAFDKLRKQNRKAWLANVCLTGIEHPEEVTFYRNPVSSETGGLIYDLSYGAIAAVTAQSIPLYTLLLALNQTTVDFFSLDVEGNELQVLKSIPFDSVNIKILTVDHKFIQEGKQALLDFMKSKNYVLYKTIKKKITNDSIFIHRSVFHQLTSNET